MLRTLSNYIVCILFESIHLWQVQTLSLDCQCRSLCCSRSDRKLMTNPTQPTPHEKQTNPDMNWCTFNPVFVRNLTVCCFLLYHPTSSSNETCDPCLLLLTAACSWRLLSTSAFLCCCSSPLGRTCLGCTTVSFLAAGNWCPLSKVIGGFWWNLGLLSFASVEIL